MARRPEHGSPRYQGPAGSLERYYVAEVDDSQQPIERLSGLFTNRHEAAPALRWIRQRHPRARLIRELLYRVIED